MAVSYLQPPCRGGRGRSDGRVLLVSEYADRGEGLVVASFGDGSRDPKENFRLRCCGVDGTELDCCILCDCDCDVDAAADRFVWPFGCSVACGCVCPCLGAIFFGGVSLGFMTERFLSGLWCDRLPWPPAAVPFPAELSLSDTLLEDRDRGPA